MKLSNRLERFSKHF